MAGKKTKKAHAPETLGVLVRCKEKHVLPGLFVIYRLLPDLHPPGTEGKHDRKLWDFHLTLRPEFAPTADPLPDGLPDWKYALAFSDRKGFLEPVAGEDPWPRFYGREKASPHQPKITSKGTYSCYLVRHPSVDVARHFLRVLNRVVEAGATALPPEHVIDLVLEPLKGNKQQLVLEVEEKPDWYAPRGGDAYDGWTLYQDMPHAECKPVQDAVKALLAHLGALRYPVGAQEAPYVPNPVKQKSKPKEPPKPDLFYIDSVGHSAIHAFQLDHAARNVTKVGDVDRCHGSTLTLAAPKFAPADLSSDATAESSWAYLDASPLDGRELEEVSDRKVAADAVVETQTANAIGFWLEKGYRKAGLILVDVDPNEGPATWHIYTRSPTAMRIKAWREMIKAMGCDYGLRSGHSFRHVMSGVSTKARGVAALSLHKTGSAIDLGVHGSEGEGKVKQEDYSKPVKEWPILFERKVDARMGGTKRADLQMHRIGWRLYGHSSFDGAELAAHGTGRDDLILSLLKHRERVLEYFTDRMGKGPDKLSDAEVGRVADEVLARCQGLVDALQRDPQRFASEYFRPFVLQWHYDPFNPEGGTLGNAVKPGDPIVLGYANPATATTVPGRGKSFVNLSALGYRLRMRRIFAQSSGWQDEATDAHDHVVYKHEQAMPASGGFGVIVARLRQLSDSEHFDSLVVVNTPTAAGVDSFKVAAFDLDFADEWVVALDDARKDLPHDAATLSIRLGVPPKDKPTREFAGRLGGQFAKRRFRCTNGVELKWGDFTLKLAAGQTQTGAQWKTKIEEMLDELSEARKKKTWEDDEAAKKAALEKKKKVVKGTKKSEPKSEGDWSLELHPLLLKTGDALIGEPDQSLLLPGMGTGRALEWWHYQDETCNSESWLSLMTSMGFSADVMGKDPKAALYHRPGMGYPGPKPAQLDANGKVKVKASDGWDTKNHRVTDEAEDRVENWPTDLDKGSLYAPTPPKPIKKAPAPPPPKKGKAPAKAH